MVNLKKASKEELLKELQRREEEERHQALPSPLPNPDFSELQKMIVDGVTRMDRDDFVDDDFKYYVYEAAMEVVYGKTIWTWMRARFP